MASLEQSHSHSPSRSSEHNVPSTPSTTFTTPDQSPGADDDIWDTSSDHQYPPNTSHDDSTFTDLENNPNQEGMPQRRPDPILSDLPTLRRQHMTSGYREGLAIGKAQVMQRGFDEGYPFGVDLGLRIGVVLGVLEGALAALKKTGAGPSSAGNAQAPRKGRRASSSAGNLPAPSSPTTSTVTEIGTPQALPPTRDETLSFLTSLYARAEKELKISELMKVLDDEKVAKLEPGDALPTEIENVVKRWEEVVLGGAFGVPASMDGA